MYRKICRRLLYFIPVLIGISFISFCLIYLAPGDPAEVRLTAAGVNPSASALADMRVKMGLDRPFFMQYFNWLSAVLRGDMGRSYANDMRVMDIILGALPSTLVMAASAMIITICISIPIGIYTALHRGKTVDAVIGCITFTGIALPNFIVGIALLYIFSYRLKLIPILDSGDIKGMILPACTLAITMSSKYIRQIRAAAVDELSKPYISGLRSRGISEFDILFKNVLKNIMVMLITITGISIGSLLGGTVVVESIFNRPGIGTKMLSAIGARDYPLIQGLVLWITLVFMLVNLITDISYTWFNPKIRNI